MSVKKIKLTLGGMEIEPAPFDGPGVDEIATLFQQVDDEAFAEALANARAARVIVVTKKDRDNPIYVDKSTRRLVSGIELNLRLRKVLK